MARKTRVTFNFTWIIFMIIAYNLFFGDDDADKKEVKIQDQPKATVEEVSTQKSIDLTKLKEEGIKVLDQVVDKVKEEIEANKSKQEPEPPPEEKREETMVAEPEKEKEEVPELKPLNDKPKETGMKKL
jgi:hypothetical protein